MGPAPGPRCPAGNGKPPRGSVIYAGASAPWRGQTLGTKIAFPPPDKARDKAFVRDFPKKFQGKETIFGFLRARKFYSRNDLSRGLIKD